jgi:uncharacterized protein (DUF983 family)
MGIFDLFRKENSPEEKEEIARMLGLVVNCPKCGRNLGRRDQIHGTLVGGAIGLQTVCPHCNQVIYLR